MTAETITIQEIERLEPGDPMDNLIDQLVMKKYRPLSAVPRYSTDIRDALILIENMRMKEWSLDIKIPVCPSAFLGHYCYATADYHPGMVLDAQLRFVGRSIDYVVAICQVALQIALFERDGYGRRQ